MPDDAPESAPTGALAAWLEERRRLVTELAQALREGFNAVATFRAAAYLECVERQDSLSQRIRGLDRRMPAVRGEARDTVLAAAAELRAMNAELKTLNEVHAALLEQGSRSVRCFQRVWALTDAAYGPPGHPREGK